MLTNVNIALFYFGLRTSRNELTPSLLGREQGMGPLTKKKNSVLEEARGKGERARHFSSGGHARGIRLVLCTYIWRSERWECSRG